MFVGARDAGWDKATDKRKETNDFSVGFKINPMRHFTRRAVSILTDQ